MNLHCFRFILILLTVANLTSRGQNLPETKSAKDKIQIALLLDISGSMDPLIFKVKSQFWRIANYVKKGIKKGKRVTVEFSVITYGGAIGTADPYTSILSDLTSDLDSISDKLHQIQSGGSEEHCWSAINITLNKLSWSKRKGDLKIILIAGNESFNQGDAEPEIVMGKAKKLKVIINTVYCNQKEDSISNEWKAAATIGKGSYFFLNLEDSLRMKENFMDKKLAGFNDKLNSTFIPFGPKGEIEIKRMVMQDRNSKLSGMPFFRERVAYKAQDSFTHPDWDLVDAFKADSTVLTRLTHDHMPQEFKFLNEDEWKNLLEEKWYTRQSYKQAIRNRYEMITRYLGEPKSKNELDTTVKEIVNKEGKKKGFVFDSARDPSN